MTDSVKEQDVATPEKGNHDASDKELNFRRLEAERERERENRIRAEMETKQLRQEMMDIKEMLKPKEKDPLDDEDLDPDLKQTLQQIRARDRAEILKQSKDIARQTYEEEKGRGKRENPVGELRKSYADYDEYMNENTIANLQKNHPEFVEGLMKIPDDYERRKIAYKFVKKIQNSSKTQTAQEKVDENMENPYYTPASHGTPNAMDFDLRSKESRQAAYQQLKANQRKPIGIG